MEDFKKGMKEVRSGIQKVVGHKRRERHAKAKAGALEKKIASSPHLNRTEPKAYYAQMSHRIDNFSKLSNNPRIKK